MRIARVIGTVTMSHTLAELPLGQYVIADAVDGQALGGLDRSAPRQTPMPESLVVFDQRGAAVGQLIAVSEGGEATMPFRPQRMAIDAYCAAILDTVSGT